MKQKAAALNAVITGATSGIGMAIASAIAASGGTLFLIGRDVEKLNYAFQELAASASLVLLHAIDLTSNGAIDGLQHRIAAEFGNLDVLIHCAGAYVRGRMEESSVQELDALYRINVHVPYALTQALLPLLKSRQGQVVFLNSSQGIQAKANTGAYAATRHALRANADSLRQEVNADGVRVLSVYAGRTATPGMQRIFEMEDMPYRPELLVQASDIARAVMTALEMPRTAEITDIHIRPFIKSY
jgi:NADP-dependent 3-hydroxy acid dehydrogenase YdfG